MHGILRKSMEAFCLAVIHNKALYTLEIDAI